MLPAYNPHPVLSSGQGMVSSPHSQANKMQESSPVQTSDLAVVESESVAVRGSQAEGDGRELVPGVQATVEPEQGRPASEWRTVDLRGFSGTNAVQCSRCDGECT
jgi:hypothetical protein